MHSRINRFGTFVYLKRLCDEEEKSLKVMKTSLKKLEDRQEYMTAFIQKILSTEGQCILRHKMQVRVFFKDKGFTLNLSFLSKLQAVYTIQE